MEVQCEFLGSHSLGKAQQFTVVENRKVVTHAEFLLDLYLAAVELELAERTDLGKSVDLCLLQVDQFLVCDIE